MAAMSGKRLHWIDVAKGMGIMLVVYGHVMRGLVSAGLAPDSPTFQVVDSVIYSFHMPLFFFLAGIFLDQALAKRGVGGVVLSKVDTILYPYLVWSLLQGFIEVLLARYTNGATEAGDVLALLWAPRAQFWFLYALFQIFIVSAVLFSFKARWLPYLILRCSAIVHFRARRGHGALHSCRTHDGVLRVGCRFLQAVQGGDRTRADGDARVVLYICGCRIRLPFLRRLAILGSESVFPADCVHGHCSNRQRRFPGYSSSFLRLGLSGEDVHVHLPGPHSCGKRDEGRALKGMARMPRVASRHCWFRGRYCIAHCPVQALQAMAIDVPVRTASQARRPGLGPGKCISASAECMVLRSA